MTHRIRTTALAITALAATAPAATAHTSVYTSQTKTAPGGVLTAGPVNYLVSNHGYNVVLREDNGRATHGVLNYKELPGDWRKNQTKATLLATATGAQAHAVCDLPALREESAILAWQESDPFYDYVPWQATPSGLGDQEEVDRWLAVVKEKTNVDLTKTADPAAACLGAGGGYFKADSVVTAGSALASGDIGLVADPLKKQIEDYKAQLAAAASAKATVDAALKASASPVTVKLVGTPSRAALVGDGVKAEVTGSPNAPIEVTLTVTKKLQTQHRLPTRTLATATVRLDAAGKGSVTLKPSSKSITALAKVKSGLAATATARVYVSATTSTTL